MTIRCTGCGHEFSSGSACPRCGLRLGTQPSDATQRPPEESDQTVLAVKEAGQHAPPSGRSAVRRLPLVIGISALALALVAGGAYAALRVLAPGVVPQLPGAEPVELKVTGAPPSTAGHWASGVREVWRIDGEHASGIESDTEVYQDPGESTATAWTVTDFVGDTTHAYSGLDPDTGRQLWTGKMFRACAAELIGKLMPCLDWLPGKNKYEYDPALVLIDWRTGKATTTRKLSDLGIDADINPASEIAVRGDALVLVLPQYPHQEAEDLGELAGVTVARISADAMKVVWQTTVRGCPGCEQGATRIDASDLQHGILTTTYGQALDFNSGKSLFPDSSFVVPIADGVLNASRSDTPTITAPDGTRVVVVSDEGGWTIDGALPPLPLRMTLRQASEESAWAKVVAYDPATGQSAWQTPLEIIVGTMPMRAGQLLYDGQRLVVLNDTEIVAVDARTGGLAWRRSIVGSDGPGPSLYGLKLALDQTILAYGYDYGASGDDSSSATVALDPDSGAVMWSVAGVAEPAPNPEGSQSLLQVDLHGRYVARLDPADRPATPPAVPADAPACPPGMAAISWTQYADGAILLCRADQRYAVVFPSHPDWQAGELNFSGGGYEVAFSNQTRVRVSLGGTVVYTSTNGAVTAQQATKSWNNATGEVKLAVPSDVKSCPAGSWPISLSTYQGGWLLVCGTATDAPSSMLLNTGSSVVQIGSVAYRNGGYCGTGDVGTVCGYRSPAVVSVTDPGGTVTQHSADANYFDGHGQGGTGKGNGSYGVEAPDDNAKDQVRYLTQILQKSMAGRTNLQSAVDRVRACTDLPGAVSSFNDVLANRQELLDALDSTPVDAVPNGSQLVASLRNALQLSHDSDQVWLQWAQAQQSDGCADGQNSDLYRQVQAMNENVATAKEDFLAQWNDQIVPAYHAPRFKTSQI